MKMVRSFSLLLLLGCVTACQNHSGCNDIVCETYVHRYGVPLGPQDWSARGQHGQVVSMRKDGVTITSDYDAGILHGDCTYTFPYRDVIQKKEVYHAGNMTQELTYYPNGLPQQQVAYDSSNRKILTTWYENGAPQCHEIYEGVRLAQGEYYNFDHQVESRIDEFNGLCTRRDGQGQLLSVDMIQNGEMLQRTTYHSNGVPATITPYVNAIIQGQRRTYLSSGEPETVEEWNQNVQQGLTTVFEHGEKVAEVPYVNGNKHGIERRYRDEQILVQEMNWVQGYKHGPCYTYLSQPPRIDWYFKDRAVVNKATYDMLCNQCKTLF